jgi:hypothetical protein
MTENRIPTLNTLGLRIKYSMLKRDADKLKSEIRRLKDVKDHLSLENPFCENCKETDCSVSNDGTCKMIREYLKTKQEK